MSYRSGSIDGKRKMRDGDIFERTVGRMAGVAPMPYAKLVDENAFTKFVRPEKTKSFYAARPTWNSGRNQRASLRFWLLFTPLHLDKIYMQLPISC